MRIPREFKPTLDKLTKLCEQKELRFKVCSTEPTLHVQIYGKLTVDSWPCSKKRSAYLQGSHKSQKNVSIEEAVRMAESLPKPVPKDRQARRRVNASRRRWKRQLFVKDPHCCWCGIELTLEADKPNTATLEHYIPLFRGGADRRDNIKGIACKPCNEARGNKMPELFDQPKPEVKDDDPPF